MTWLLPSLLVAAVAVAQPGTPAAPPTGGAPPAEQSERAPLPSPVAAHAPRIEADLRALDDPGLTHAEAVRAALDLRSEMLHLRSELPGAPEEVRRAAITAEEAAGGVVTAAARGDSSALDRATARFASAWSALRGLQPAAPQP